MEKVISKLNGHRQSALFLDRDGVINKEKGYVYKIEDFEFVDGIFDLCSDALRKNYLIFVITNQAGIGRGYYTVDDFEILTNWMLEMFKNAGIAISKVYFSPYHPIHGLGLYKQFEETRKPGPGMINLAKKEFQLNLQKSVLIGDKMSDVLAGFNAGVGQNLLLAPKQKSVMSKGHRNIFSLREAQDYL